MEPKVVYGEFNPDHTDGRNCNPHLCSTIYGCMVINLEQNPAILDVEIDLNVNLRYADKWIFEPFNEHLMHEDVQGFFADLREESGMHGAAIDISKIEPFMERWNENQHLLCSREEEWIDDDDSWFMRMKESQNDPEMTMTGGSIDG